MLTGRKLPVTIRLQEDENFPLKHGSKCPEKRISHQKPKVKEATKMRYNRSEIMRKAWEMYKNNQKRVAAGRAKATTFAAYLKYSWEMEKETVQKREKDAAINAALEAKKVAVSRPTTRIEEIDHQIFMINMADFRTAEDRDLINKLNAERNSLVSAA